jgi:glycosyltransferase involved in cell wall biosynthesis
MREVLIFRHNLFKRSEPFITQQAQALRRYRPLYLGRLRYGDAPEGARSLALADGTGWPLTRSAWQMITANPSRYLRLLGAGRPALIHAHFGVEGVYALPLAARLAVPLITTFHGFDATLARSGLLANPAWQRYLFQRRRLAAEGAMFLCASAFLKEKILDLGFPAARSKVHYTGVDLGAITPREPDEEEALILHVARLEPVKGTAVLLRAFALIAAEHPRVRLKIIGEGSLSAHLAREAAQSGFGERIEFAGARPHAEVLTWMRRAAVVVIPSIRTRSGREEGLGMATLEAAATGVPVIGSRVGGIPEAIDDGVSGFLVPQRDPEALASRLRAVLADVALRLRFGHKGREKMARQFDLARQTEELERLYDEVTQASS